jgi:APA family basic amino acid/polyamine antiporter
MKSRDLNTKPAKIESSNITNNDGGKPIDLKRELSFFDVTNMVVGAIVGSDIYVASAITAGLIGPFSIVVWLIDAVMATILALVFAYCSYYVPRVGGPFAYVSAAFDDFYGFLAGWSMWLAEVISIPVFAITFTNYLQYFIALGTIEQIAVKFVFIFGLTYVNIRGVKGAGRFNDVLTIIKLLPLFIMVAAGLFSFFVNPTLLNNYTPFIPSGFDQFGTSLVVIFWAYAGFELAPLPASEIKDPAKTLPRAIIAGMAIVMLFYLTTNFVVYGMLSAPELAKTATPLLSVGLALFGTFGAVMMSAGALFSVSGSNESDILGTSRLSFAMAIDGLFPKAFSQVHPKYQTPYMSLIIQAVIAFVLSLFTGIRNLISFSVFNLAFSYLLTCMAAIALQKDRKKLPGQNFIPLLGIIVCLFLIYATSVLDKIIGFSLILLGIPLYVYFSPKTDINHLKELFTSEEAVLFRTAENQNNFLAHAITHIHRLLEKR